MMKLSIGLLILLGIATIHCMPLEDDPAAALQQDSDGSKKDNLDADKSNDDSSPLSDNPMNDPESADRRDSTGKSNGTDTLVTADGASETKDTVSDADAVTTTTTTTTTEKPTTTTTTTEASTDVDEPTVEGSDNNTKTMKGTTFHVAFQDKSVEFYPEMNSNIHDIHRHSFLTAMGEVYKGVQDYKQAVVIKFSQPNAEKEKEKEASTRALTAGGVIVDMYLRFYTAGKHLNRLTDALKSGKLGTHEVHPLFIRAYVAEPTGLVCTPDCKVQCYSYCDAGCCHVNILQNIELPTPSPVEQFINDQQQALKTGQTTPKPCEENECKQEQQQQQQQPAMILPIMMPQQQQMMPMMPQQMPCQGAACGAQMMPMMPQQMPCQGAACGAQMMPMMPQQQQMPCQGAACGAPMMPAPQMCPSSCSQVCAPSCPNQCCGGSAGGMSAPGMNGMTSMGGMGGMGRAMTSQYGR